METSAPRHDKAPFFARSGIFRNLRTFSDLEQRIESLPTEKERGDAFEVFVEAFLNTDKIAQAEAVWSGGKVPREIRGKLNLPSSDYGIDGVYRNKLGEMFGYQVKFRTARRPLTYADLATFFGLSERCDRRHVLTNSIGIAAVAELRTDFQTTRGGDFDRLDAAQLADITAWIEGVPAVTEKKREPHPHQRAALSDIAAELLSNDRATAVMACGTGKTMVALWAAEAAQPNRVLVLVPSLNLLRQTLHEWYRRTNWGERFRYLCVCSDPKVAKGLDEIEIRPEHTDFPVRTEPATVGGFLDGGGDAVSVVFCTYHSAPIVGEAMKGRQPFDIGIFDEAHKTTGREGTRYAFALQDENLPIRKRLFLTATPRHYDIRKRDKEGDFAVASMDDEAVYGRVAHRLTFAQAAEQKIIVPYRVVISVVDSEMIDNALMEHSEVSIKGDPVRAKWVAHQIALKRAVEEHNLKRLITFHSSIKAAKAFASDAAEGIGMHLPDFQRFHVSGAQPTAERDEHMGEFKRAQRGVITNARCLTEGVDVPSVDMVAFMNPRRSRVDIVQAVGRAMRTAEDKTCGYVLVPLFLEKRKGETLDQALERSDFDEIAQVLNAMRENDEDLSDIIQVLAVDRGRTGGFDESRLRDKVEVLAPQIGFSELASSICVRLVGQLGTTWDERYGQLTAYKLAHGDCNVPAKWKADTILAQWCSTQRTERSRNRLTSDRILRLEHLGFVWHLPNDQWRAMYEELHSYWREYRHCNVPENWPENRRLSRWVATQRQEKKKNRLSDERIRLLDDIKFSWNPFDSAWDKNFASLVEFYMAHGHFVVPPRWPKNPQLTGWVNKRREEYRTETLSADRIRQLEGIGFPWAPVDDSWNIRFAELVEFKNTHGHCDVRERDNLKLAHWATELRKRRKQRGLSPERLAMLDALGFVWNPLETDWEEMFAVLCKYKALHGDCKVPTKWRENEELAEWVRVQRMAKKSGKISAERVERLNVIGFVWIPFAGAWESWFSKLAEYKIKYGHCNVPQKWKENPSLGRWVSDQRKKWRDKTLRPEYVKRLAGLGLTWQPKSL